MTSFGSSLAAGWGDLVDDEAAPGARELLATSRSLFAYAWFKTTLVIACLVALQAVEAVVRQVVLPDVAASTPLARLARRAAAEGRATSADVDVILTGARIRNQVAHPGGEASFTVGPGRASVGEQPQARATTLSPLTL